MANTWQGRADKSNKKEQARVDKKYPGTKKIGQGAFTESDMEADPFQEADPVLDVAPERTHKLDQYTRASGLSKPKAKKILMESGTLQK